MRTVKRYLFPIVMLLFAGLLSVMSPGSQGVIVSNIGWNIREMVSVMPAIFILIGLADVWVSRETVIKYMGQKSALIGVILSVLLGAVATGPLYTAFPIASVMLRKGASFSNVMIFVGAWSTLKVPMFLFETSSLGATFSVTRWICSLAAVMAIAVALNVMLPQSEKAEIVRHQDDMVEEQS